ncbi:MAG: hypothetical protein ACP5N1_07185 [Candidatus Woesearchaeota archaeon]
MGSYDTAESYTPPSRNVTPSRDTDSSESSRSTNSTRDYSVSMPAPVSTSYDGAPLLISLGGGLTPSRIVKKIPEEFSEKTLYDVVKYMLATENLVSTEETTIADAVRQRMQASDYRGIINSRFNYHNDRLKTDLLKTYLIGDERNTEGGPIKFNKADIAIVSHDEGGRKYYTIDKLFE